MYEAVTWGVGLGFGIKNFTLAPVWFDSLTAGYDLCGWTSLVDDWFFEGRFHDGAGK